VSFDVRPATSFAGVSAILGPKNPQATVCWCLSHRLDSKTNKALRGPQRGAYVEELTRRPVAPGVLAYDGEDAVGWAAVAPRAQLPYERSRQIPHVDEQPVWTIWCFRVAPGHRGQGVARALLEGAVDFARKHRAPAVEGYPVDNQGRKVDATMAYVGTRSLFEATGFTLASQTSAVAGGFPRVVMRRELSRS
jgi:GNAT superfamily N-acetyltransferase